VYLLYLTHKQEVLIKSWEKDDVKVLAVISWLFSSKNTFRTWSGILGIMTPPYLINNCGNESFWLKEDQVEDPGVFLEPTSAVAAEVRTRERTAHKAILPKFDRPFPGWTQATESKLPPATVYIATSRGRSFHMSHDICYFILGGGPESISSNQESPY
jgi:hypothetical protein